MDILISQILSGVLQRPTGNSSSAHANHGQVFTASDCIYIPGYVMANILVDWILYWADSDLDLPATLNINHHLVSVTI